MAASTIRSASRKNGELWWADFSLLEALYCATAEEVGLESLAEQLRGLAPVGPARKLGPPHYDTVSRRETIDRVSAPDGLGMVEDARRFTDRPPKVAVPGALTLMSALKLGGPYRETAPPRWGGGGVGRSTTLPGWLCYRQAGLNESCDRRPGPMLRGLP